MILDNNRRGCHERRKEPWWWTPCEEVAPGLLLYELPKLHISFPRLARGPTSCERWPRDPSDRPPSKWSQWRLARKVSCKRNAASSRLMHFKTKEKKKWQTRIHSSAEVKMCGGNVARNRSHGCRWRCSRTHESQRVGKKKRIKNTDGVESAGGGRGGQK